MQDLDQRKGAQRAFHSTQLYPDETHTSYASKQQVQNRYQESAITKANEVAGNSWSKSLAFLRSNKTELLTRADQLT